VTDAELIAGLYALVQRQDELLGDILVTCADCGAAWYGAHDDPCDWCAWRREQVARDVLEPPRPRGYGYATPADLAALGYDPAADREADLRCWIDNLRITVGSGIITRRAKNDAIRRARKARAG
jgi:hypothetical protein